ncbi:MAG: DUF2125 domain-containing protein [Paracoccus sp. (in: a-proteobacteria)]|nr:DUF2125 domain-containing protein [Paracoccus sp. (in: a-proteobacteria)]
MANPSPIRSIDVAYADDEGHLNIALAIGKMSYNGDSLIPAGTNIGPDLLESMKAGLKMVAAAKVETLSAKMSGAFPGAYGNTETLDIAADTNALDLQVLIQEGRLGYVISTGASDFSATVPDLPFPIQYSANSSNFTLDMPTLAAADPQPFKLAYGFDGLELSDSIWGMFDPSGAFPRDPAKINLDLSGLARLDVDLLDEEAMANLVEAPGALNELAINDIEISAVGANIQANGNLTMPEGNVDEPVGKINARLTGVNELVDRLIAAGFMPEDQAMGIRMMLALFTTADPSDATVLTSEIDFREGGQIFANGQQVK